MSCITLDRFRVELCSHPAQLDTTYRLRHEVFVQEYGYLPASHYTDCRERDEFDRASAALLITDLDTGYPAACARIIVPGWLERLLPLPIEHETLPEEGIATPRYSKLDPLSWGEISRVTVSPAFRGIDVSNTRNATGILMPAIIALGYELQLREMYSMSEPPMARLAKLRGIPMKRVGKIVEYHGRRAPYSIQAREAAAAASAKTPDLFAALREWAFRSLIDSPRPVPMPAAA